MSKHDTDEDQFAWNVKVDAEGGEWEHLMRRLRAKLNAGEHSRAMVLEEGAFDDLIKKVPPAIKFPAGYDGMSLSQQNALQHRMTKRDSERREVKKDNKWVVDAYTRSLADLENLFTYNCAAATALRQAASVQGDSATKFKEAWSKLKQEYEPNQTIDFMKLKQLLFTHADGAMPWTAWRSKFYNIYETLKAKGKEPTLEELDQIVILNVQNPAFTMYRQMLIVDATKTRGPGEEREYTWANFIHDANLLCSHDPVAINGWREGTIVKGGAAKTTKHPRVRGNGACWRCGAMDHRAANCRATKCVLCGKILTGAEVDHALNCGEAAVDHQQPGANAKPAGGSYKKKKVTASKKASGDAADYRAYSVKKLRSEYARIKSAAAAKAVELGDLPFLSDRVSPASKKRRPPAHEEEEAEAPATQAVMVKVAKLLQTLNTQMKKKSTKRSTDSSDSDSN